MDAAACRYSIIAATAQNSRQLVFLLTTTAWEVSRIFFPKRKLKMNPFPPGICITCAATATDNSNPRFIVWNATQEIATSRTMAKRSANVGKVAPRRRMSVTNLRNWLATSGGACFTDTPPRRCSSCALAKYPLTSGLATGFPSLLNGVPVTVHAELFYHGTFQLRHLPFV